MMNFVVTRPESVGFVRQRIFRTALLLLRWNLSAVLRSGSLALCVLAPLYAVILGIGLQNTAAMVALSRASLLVEMPFFQFLLDCSITIAQCSILFLLYRRLREGDAAPEDTQNGKPVRAKGRRLLAAAVLLRAGAASPELLQLGVDTASAQGWNRPLMAWLLLQVKAAEQAGDGASAAAIQRRLDLLQSAGTLKK